MTEIKERIQEIRKELGISLRDFAKRIYISRSLLSGIEQGKKNINDRTIQLISTEFSVNKDWLLTGKGDMFNAPPPDVQLQKLVEIFNQLDQGLRDCLLEQSKALLKIKREKRQNQKSSS
jgi:transcriptional regulator with XRE-family HTH domain